MSTEVLKQANVFFKEKFSPALHVTGDKTNNSLKPWPPCHFSEWSKLYVYLLFLWINQKKKNLRFWLVVWLVWFFLCRLWSSHTNWLYVSYALEMLMLPMEN